MEYEQNNHSKRKLWLIVAGVLLAVLIAGLAAWRLSASDSPAPDSIQADSGSGVYYPNAAKLPAGYTFDSSSINQAADGVTILSVKGGSDKSVSISQQAQPDSDVIENFIKTYIPLHTTISTSLGQAEMGASGQSSNLKTVVSLPVKDGPWLIITAPADISQPELKQIIESLKH
jgi:hypothetical protein